ncbi:MAG: GNAT family N-acetyltransferase [Deltaproteobacteria bacterium]|nr:GNAT family N-acetyltransferase [Deltaproteobacteria bacterium]
MLTFTKATIKDLPQILTIEQVSFSSPWSEASLAATLCDPLTLTLVGRFPGRTEVGAYSCCKIFAPEAELLKVAVSPQLRRRGMAWTLLRESLQGLRQAMVTTVHLEVSEKNLKAIALYEKMGFILSGRRPGYYDNNTNAALLLQINL